MDLSILLKNYQNLVKKVNNLSVYYNNSKLKLLLVTKNLSNQEIKFIINNTNHRLFAENKIQDALKKWQDIIFLKSVKLHFIGKLQSNKIKKAVQLFDVIESVTSEDMACKINEEALKQNKRVQIFLQINIGGELQKNGILLKKFDKVFSQIKNRDINIEGIMCIPPANGPAFFYFGYMYKIAKEYKIKELSMGMSSDFEIAIKFGSTEIRIGKALIEQYSEISLSNR